MTKQNLRTRLKCSLAQAAGYQAAKEGKKAIPALCPTYLDLIAGLPVGGGGVEIARAWSKGYFEKALKE